MSKLLPKNAQLIPDHAKKVFQGVIFEVWQWDMKMFDGTTETFEMLRRPDTVSVFAIKNNKVVIVKELQPHWSAPKVSVTGGRVDEGEDPLDAAKRETAEELGMEFSDWKLIKIVQPFEKSEWFVYTYVCWNHTKDIPVHHDSGEQIEPMEVTIEELKELTKDARARLDRQLINSLNTVDDLLNMPEVV